MKIQMLKMHGNYDFTVILDTEKDWTEQYSLYIHKYKLNQYGYSTKRKYLVDRCSSMDTCLAWIMDIRRDYNALKGAISAKQILAS